MRIAQALNKDFENAWQYCPACDREKERYHNRNKDATRYCECDPQKNEEITFDAIVDWRGNETKPGDIVAYPYLSGRSAQLATGILDRIYLKASTHGGTWETRLRVIPVDRSWWNLYSSNPDTPYEDRKPSTLMFWDRFILLERKISAIG